MNTTINLQTDRTVDHSRCNAQSGQGRLLFSLALMSLALGVCAQRDAAAITTNWNGLAANDLWTDAGNWDNGVPVSSDTANITGTSGSPFTVDLNGGIQDIANITLNTTWTDFINGTLDQNQNTGATFTAIDTTFDSTSNFRDPGGVDWTRVTRASGSVANWNWGPGNGTQISLTDVSNGSGGSFALNNMNLAAGSGYDATANNSKIAHFTYRNNPTSPTTGSLTLENGSIWRTSSSWESGTGTGEFTLTLDNSTLQIGNNIANPTFGPNTKIIADNGMIEVDTNSSTHLEFQMTDPTFFDGDGLTIDLAQTGGNAVLEMEAMSEDVGPFTTGFTVNNGNFSFDHLILGNPFNNTNLLQDHDNSTANSDPEVFYVRTLEILGPIGNVPASEGLFLNGASIYYENLIGDLDDLNIKNALGGTVQQVTAPIEAPVPEPSTALLVLGGLGLLRFRRRRI